MCRVRFLFCDAATALQGGEDALPRIRGTRANHVVKNSS
jgi:hypothetical protein